jgi:hypothetical protein
VGQVLSFGLGTTRVVLLIGRVAIKLARHKRGRACNRFEADLFQSATAARKAMLCPAVWCSKSGIVLIARRARPLTQQQFNSIWGRTLRRWDGDYSDSGPVLPDWDEGGPRGLESPFEPKPSNWGWLDGRLVALDYSVQIAVSDLNLMDP